MANASRGGNPIGRSRGTLCLCLCNHIVHCGSRHCEDKSVAIIDMSALFHFSSLLLVILLCICTCTYVRATAPGLVDRNKNGALGLVYKAARIGERLSPYVSLACIIMAGYMIL